LKLRDGLLLLHESGRPNRSSTHRIVLPTRRR
jgi:hypothetical protein